MGLYILYGIGALVAFFVLRWFLGEWSSFASFIASERIKSYVLSIAKVNPEKLTTPALRLAAFKKLLSFERKLLMQQSWGKSIPGMRPLIGLPFMWRMRPWKYSFVKGMYSARREVLAGGDLEASTVSSPSVARAFTRKLMEILDEEGMPRYAQALNDAGLVIYVSSEHELLFIDEENPSRWAAIAEGVYRARMRRLALI